MYQQNNYFGSCIGRFPGSRGAGHPFYRGGRYHCGHGERSDNSQRGRGHIPDKEWMTLSNEVRTVVLCARAVNQVQTLYNYDGDHVSIAAGLTGGNVPREIAMAQQNTHSDSN